MNEFVEIISMLGYNSGALTAVKILSWSLPLGALKSINEPTSYFFFSHDLCHRKLRFLVCGSSDMSRPVPCKTISL